MNVRRFLAAVVFFSASIAGSAHAKRSAPAEVKPVDVGDVRLVVRHAQNACGQTGGCVEIRDCKTGALRRAVTVYTVTIDPNIEKDVQEVFITDLHVEGQRVRVRDERKQDYYFDL